LAVPIAIPTVAAASAGASLMPSPTNSVDDPQLSLGRDTGVDLLDPDMLREPLHLALAVARNEHHALEPVGRPEVLDERGAILPRAVVEAEQADG
jgi:hypothetical protein